MRIIFFGSDGWFSRPVLSAILKAGIEVALIVTKGNAFVTPKSKIKNQKSKIIQVKAENDISVERLEAKFNSQFAKDNRPDAIVLASFGPPFLAAEVLNWPKYGCLNVHASLLPRWRGASPVFAAIAAGDKETGVSIMRMTEEIDRGTVLGQKKMVIRSGVSWRRQETPDNRETLTKRLGILGGKLIVETLKKLEKGQITEVTQPKKSPTPYTRRLTKESGRINWSQSPIEIERFIRAAFPWPSAMSNVKFKIKNEKWQTIQNVKILKVHLERIQNSEFPGLASARPRAGRIQNYLIIDEIQLPGKNPISWKQFLAGHPGAKLE